MLPRVSMLAQAVEDELSRPALDAKRRRLLEARRSAAYRALVGFGETQVLGGDEWLVAWWFFKTFENQALSYAEGVGDLAFEVTCDWLGLVAPEVGRRLRSARGPFRRALKAWVREELRGTQKARGLPPGKAATGSDAKWDALAALFEAVGLPTLSGSGEMRKRLARIEEQMARANKKSSS